MILYLVPAGHSLGGFTAAACAVFFQEVLKVVTFESPGLTTFCECCAFAHPPHSLLEYVIKLSTMCQQQPQFACGMLHGLHDLHGSTLSVHVA